MSSKIPSNSVIKHLGSERAARAYVRNDGRWSYESHVNYDGVELKVSWFEKNQMNLKKIKWTRKKIYVWRKNFSFVNIFFLFSFGFSTFVLEHFGLWKVGIITIFGFILLSYYLTIIVIFNSISFKKWIKLVKNQAKVHKNVLISNKTCGDILDQWHLSRCGRIFNQWLYEICGRSVSETGFQWRNMCEKSTSSWGFHVSLRNSL